jgi:hypothetical protein
VKTLNFGRTVLETPGFDLFLGDIRGQMAAIFDVAATAPGFEGVMV